MIPSTQDVEATTVSGSDPPPLLLQVIAGLHSGACAPLAAGETLLIGTGDDCDVVLSDRGVARHHCILARNGSRIAVRAVDDVLTVAEEAQVEPGQLMWIAAETELRLGDATVEITSTPSARAAHSLDQGTGSHTRDRIGPLRRYHWGIAGVAVMVCAASPLTHYVRAHSVQGDAESAKITASAAVRTGAAVAHDVAEVLRLSGVVSEVQYTGPGTVTVRGHLGDPKALNALIESRAMRDINGLQRVLAVNLDQPSTSEPAAEPPPGGQIVAVSDSRDPYVTTADGSRYYLGAQLPQGGRLAGLLNGDVLIERDGHIQHLKLPANVKESSISSNTPSRMQ
jgi:hypothetical protein